MSNRWVKTVLPAAFVAALGLTVTVGCEKKEEPKKGAPTPTKAPENKPAENKPAEEKPK